MIRYAKRKLKYSVNENVNLLPTLNGTDFMMSGQLILSSKPFNTFSMAMLKIFQLRLTLTPLFTTTKDPTV
jgi:hypothetical protein